MSSKPGLLMVNLGSPDAPTAKATRKYLFEFLHDYRVRMVFKLYLEMMWRSKLPCVMVTRQLGLR